MGDLTTWPPETHYRCVERQESDALILISFSSSLSLSRRLWSDVWSQTADSGVRVLCECDPTTQQPVLSLTDPPSHSASCTSHAAAPPLEGYLKAGEGSRDVTCQHIRIPALNHCSNVTNRYARSGGHLKTKTRGIDPPPVLQAEACRDEF